MRAFFYFHLVHWKKLDFGFCFQNTLTLFAGSQNKEILSVQVIDNATTNYIRISSEFREHHIAYESAVVNFGADRK